MITTRQTCPEETGLPVVGPPVPDVIDQVRTALEARWRKLTANTTWDSFWAGACAAVWAVDILIFLLLRHTRRRALYRSIGA